MTLSTTRHQALSWRLGSFRPSDRQEFSRAFDSDDGRKDAFVAVRDFVEQWERADWLEEYSVERIGKWLGKNAPSSVITDLVKWVGERETAARVALRRGIELGRSSVPH